MHPNERDRSRMDQIIILLYSDLPPALIPLFIVYCVVAHRWLVAIVEKIKSDRKTSY